MMTSSPVYMQPAPVGYQQQVYPAQPMQMTQVQPLRYPDQLETPYQGPPQYTQSASPQEHVSEYHMQGKSL